MVRTRTVRYQASSYAIKKIVTQNNSSYTLLWAVVGNWTQDTVSCIQQQHSLTTLAPSKLPSSWVCTSTGHCNPQTQILLLMDWADEASSTAVLGGGKKKEGKVRTVSGKKMSVPNWLTWLTHWKWTQLLETFQLNQQQKICPDATAETIILSRTIVPPPPREKRNLFKSRMIIGVEAE